MPIVTYPYYNVAITSIDYSTADGYDSASNRLVVRKDGSLYLAVNLLTAHFHVVMQMSATVKNETDVSATINDADQPLYVFGDQLGYVRIGSYLDGLGDESALANFGLRSANVNLDASDGGGYSDDGYKVNIGNPLAASIYCLNTKIATPSLSLSRSDEINGFQIIPTANVSITPNPVEYQNEAPAYWLIKIAIAGFGTRYQKIPYSLRSFRLRLSSGLLTYSVIGLSNGTASGGSVISSSPVLPTSSTVLSSYSAGSDDSDPSAEISINDVIAVPSIEVQSGPKVFWGTLSNAGVAYVSVNGTYGSANYAQYGQFSISDFGKDIKIKATNLGGGLTNDFEESNVVNCSSIKPGTATVAWTAPGILGISYGSGSSSSLVSFNGSTYPATSSIDLSSKAVNGSSLPVVALSLGDGSITGDSHGICSVYDQNGDPSSPVSLQGIKLGRPNLSYSSSKFSWVAVNGATSYDVYLNGSFVLNTTGLEYDPPETIGSGYVIAKGTNSFTSSLSVIYFDSDPSETIGFGILGTPTVSVSSNVVSWSAVPNADSYLIYQEISGTYKEIGSTSSLSYSVTGSEEGTYNFKVQAVSAVSTIDSSALSSPVSISFSRLQKPMLSASADGTTIYVEPETGTYPAVLIKISLNNRLLTTAGNSVSTDGARVQGRNEAVARAFSDDPLVLSSPSSSVLYFVIEDLDVDYKAYIAGVEYKVGRPISLTFAHDETLDTGTLMLDLLAEREPFEAFQRITLIGYNPDGSEKIRWCFDIEHDQVTEKQLGNTSEYLHVLTLISLSKELQTAIMPDLSITQPLDVIQRQYGVSTIDIFDRWLLWGFDSKSYWSITVDLYDEYYLFAGHDSDGNSYDSVNPGDIREKVQYGTTALLPDWAISSVVLQKSHNNELVSKEYIHPTKRWFVRGRPLATPKWTRAEVLAKIGDSSSWATSFAFTSSSDKPISAERFEIPSTGYSEAYDVYLYAEPVYRTLGGISLNVVGMYESKITPANDEVDSEDVFLMSWSFSTVSESVLASAETIGKALDRIVGAIRPQRVDGRIIGNPKYSWSLATHSSEIADEETWSGGKTLWEMLSDLGKQFGGIPRLNPDDRVTFDILGETKTGNPLFESEDSVIQGSSDMDNHASALVSQAKNLTISDHWEIWPYEGGWAAPKASDPKAAYVTRGNMAIRLPRNIDQLYSVECKDMGHGGEETLIYKRGANVKRCLEKSIWSLLPEADDSSNNYYSKSGSLVYSRGNDSIENLGALTATTETETIFGLSSGQYVIGNILAKIRGYGSASDIDPSRLLFRVAYKPYLDETVTAEQSDQSEERAHSVLAFNQDGNTLSDSRLGKVMEDKASRLGNNSFQQTYRYSDVSKSPSIGQTAIVGEDVYYADKVNITIDCNFVEATVSYTKNKNNIDPRVGVPSEYRQYEIYADNFVRRQITCDTYCVVSKASFAGERAIEAGSGFGMSKAILGLFQGTPMKRPTSFYVRTSAATIKASLKAIPTKTEVTKYDGSTASAPLLSGVDYSVGEERKIDYTLFSGDSAEISYGAVLHADFSAIGNSVTFHAQAVDNYSFGICATGAETSLDPMAWDWLGTGKYIQRDVRYVDDQGRCDLVSFALGIPDPTLIYASTDSTALEKRARKYPMAEWSLSPKDKMSNVLMDAQYYVNKDNREALSFQYSCHFLSYDSSIKVRSALASSLFDSSSGGISVSLSFVLLKKDPMSKEALSDSDYESVVSSIAASRTDNAVTLNPGMPSVTPIADCWGYAYMIGKNPLIEVKDPMASGQAHSLGNLILTVIDELPNVR